MRPALSSDANDCIVRRYQLPASVRAEESEMRILRNCVTAGLFVAAATLVVACGSSSSSSGGGGGGSSASTITIGTSLSLSGDFAADGQAFQKGYQLWAQDQN